MALKACLGCGRPTPSSRCPTCELPPRARGNAFEPTRQAVLERDGWQCQDPEHPPDQPRYLTEIPGLPNSAHVGHRVSRVDGGGDDAENLYASCRECNLHRGGRSEGS